MKLLMPVIYALLLLAPVRSELIDASRTRPFRSLLLFVAALFLSLPFSFYRSASLTVAVDYLTVSLPVVAAIYIASRRIDRVEQVYRAAIVLLLAIGTLVAAGLTEVEYEESGARISLFGSYDSNDLALLVAACTAFSLWGLSDSKKMWRVGAIASLFAAAFTVGKTGSRGGAIAIGVLIVASLLLERRFLPNWFRWSLVPLVIGLASMAPDDMTKRIRTLAAPSADYNVTEDAGRIAIWKRGIEHFGDRPINGVGAGQYGVAEGRWGERNGRSQNWGWLTAHNMYLQAAVELGIFGLVGLLGMLFPPFTLMRRTRWYLGETADHRRLRQAVVALALANVTFLVGGIFLSAAMQPMVLLLTGLGIRLSVEVDRQVPPEKGGQRRQSARLSGWRSSESLARTSPTNHVII